MDECRWEAALSALLRRRLLLRPRSDARHGVSGLSGVVGRDARVALEYIHTAFENGSPLDWEIDPDGTARIGLLYDHERASPNRAAGHWHFQLQARAGT